MKLPKQPKPIKGKTIIATNRGWEAEQKGKKDEILVSFKGLKDLLNVTVEDSAEAVEIETPTPSTPEPAVTSESVTEGTEAETKVEETVTVEAPVKKTRRSKKKAD